MRLGSQEEHGTAGWRQDVRRREAMLRGDLALLEGELGDEEPRSARVAALLDEAHAASVRRVGPLRWWSGSEIERAWGALHAAEEDLASLRCDHGPLPVVQALGQIQDAIDHGRRHGLADSDPLMTALCDMREEALTALGSNGDGSAKVAVDSHFGGVLSSVLRHAHRRCDTTYAAARAFRNRLLLLSSLLVAAVVSVVVVQWWLPGLALVAIPEDAAAIARWAWLVPIAVFGAMGGLLTSVHLISSAPRDPSPFSLPLHQVAVKITGGACAAVVGIVLVDGGMIDAIDLTSASAVLAFAVILGAGQHVLSRIVDKGAERVVAASIDPDAHDVPAGTADPAAGDSWRKDS